LLLILLPALVQAEESSTDWRQPRPDETTITTSSAIPDSVTEPASRAESPAQPATPVQALVGRADAATHAEAAPSAGLPSTDQAQGADALPSAQTEATVAAIGRIGAMVPAVSGASVSVGAPAGASAAPDSTGFTSPLPAKAEPVEYVRQMLPPAEYDEPRGPSLIERAEVAMNRAREHVSSLHVDDATTAIGFVDARSTAMSLAYDSVVPHTGGMVIQSRVQFAQQPGAGPGHQAFGDQLLDASAAGFAVRLYRAQPTRLSGVYPFVEADWWQNSRTQTININGTKVDTDLLRGLFSFNVGAHSSTASGMKLWFKVKPVGHNAGATVGARYRW